MSLVERLIDTTFTLTSGSFQGQGEANSVVLQGLRSAATITVAGGMSQGQMQLRIWGMSTSLMNQLSTLGRTPIIIGKNSVSVSAGDPISGMSTVFQGTIANAYADYNSSPEVVFIVQAFSALSGQMQSIAPSSYQGGTDAAVMLGQLAQTMGLTFENNGVSVILSNPYFAGSAMTQAMAIARAANIEMLIHDNTMSIYPKGGSRGGDVILISKDTGMIGYPFPSGQGLLGVKSIFNPSIAFGKQIQVQSVIEPANGIWVVSSLVHDIESLVFKGSWATTMTAYPPGFLQVQ